MNEAELLGADRDCRPVPVGRVVPWAEGDLPHGEDLDLNEYPVELLKMKKCRSFRADLRHKLTIIIRAHGGYGHGGLEGAAKSLRVTRQCVWLWVRWATSPRQRLMFERIDRLYSEGLETLVQEKLKNRK